MEKKSPFQITGKPRPETYPANILSQTRFNIRLSASFNPKDELLAGVSVNMLICLELFNQVQMGNSHMGQPQKSLQSYASLEERLWRVDPGCLCLTRQD